MPATKTPEEEQEDNDEEEKEADEEENTLQVSAHDWRKSLMIFYCS